jgi:hypothetical protein
MTPIHPTRRNLCLATLGALFLSACEAKPMTVSLDVVLFSYLERPIFDVFVGKRDIGVSSAYPTTGGGTDVGVQFNLGPQKVTWRLGGPEGMSRNGETVTAKNTPELKDIPSTARYLAVHIYPDETVEFIFSQHYPDFTEHGIKLAKKKK